MTTTPLYLSGINGSVALAPEIPGSIGGSAAYRFDKWKLAMKSNLPKATNFLSGGYQEVFEGVTSGTITCSGQYDSGNMPLVCGKMYQFTLGYSSAVNVVVTAIIESLEADVDVEGKETISITAQSSGSFTAAVA